MRCPMVLCLLAAVLLACGGGGGTGPKSKENGFVYVQNRDGRLNLKVRVLLVDDHPPQEEHLPSGITPGQEMEAPSNEGPVQVTSVLPGGTEVKLHFSLHKVRGLNHEATVTIDGSQVVDFGSGTDVTTRFVDYEVKPY